MEREESINSLLGHKAFVTDEANNPLPDESVNIEHVQNIEIF